MEKKSELDQFITPWFVLRRQTKITSYRHLAEHIERQGEGGMKEELMPVV
jgi:hypothetical protein